MTLHLLLDSADPITWGELFPTGIFHGITTNPSLLRQAGQPCNHAHINQLAKIAKEFGCQELHLQSWGQSAKELFDCGVTLSSLNEIGLKIYIKLPVTKEGSKAAAKLIKQNISVTFTACYEVKQVLIAEALGASFIAPYLGRISDQGKDGLAEVVAMQSALKGVGSNCNLLIASIRKSSQLDYLMSKGVSNFTINKSIAEDLFQVDATYEDSERFTRDAKNC